MKKLVMVVVGWLVSFVAMGADTVTLGFCNGEIGDGVLEFSGTGTSSAAVLLSKESLKAYENNQITTIRVGLAARINIDKLQVWIKDNLEGEPLVAAEIGKSEITKGWNSLELDSPFTINADQDLYIGYSFHQKANVKAISIVGKPLVGISYAKLGDGGNWKDVGEYGAISLEALVAGEGLNDYDLGILNASISPYPTAGKHALMVKTAVMNYGTETVEGFEISCESEDVEAISQHFSQELASSQMTSLQFIIDPDTSTNSDTNWTVKISGIDGATDKMADNNAISALCTYLKCVLIEEFTTEQCPNCPNAASLLHQALQNQDYDGRVFALCHHSGFYSDKFTQKCDREFEWFYGSMNTYAPALMFNRVRNPETARTNLSPLYAPTSVEIIDKSIAYELEKTANLVVGIAHNAERDATEVNVKVSCLRNSSFNMENPCLTVYLTEDNVKAISQSGAGPEFLHQHLIRNYSSIWGEPLEWDGDNAVFEFIFTLDPDWKFDDLGILAVVGNYDSESPLNCAVENSAYSKLTEKSSEVSVESVFTESNLKRGIFDMQGRRYNSIAGLAKGIYIVDGRKIVLK